MEDSREVHTILMPGSHHQSLNRSGVWPGSRDFFKSSPNDFNVQSRLRTTARGRGGNDAKKGLRAGPNTYYCR